MLLLPLLVPKKHRHKRNPVHIFRRRQLRQLHTRRKEIPERADMLTLPARPNHPRPADNHRHTNPPFIQISLNPPKRPAAFEKRRVSPALPMRPVITGKEHNRPPVNIQFFQQPQQASNPLIHPRNHRRIGLLRRRPVLPCILPQIRNLHPLRAGFIIRMRYRQSQIQKKRLLTAPADKLLGLLDKQIMGINRPIHTHSARMSRPPRRMPHFIRQQHLLLIAPQKLRIIIMSMRLIQIPEERIKPLPCRYPCRAGLSKTPFADNSRSIAGLLKPPCRRNIFRLQRTAVIAANPGMARMQTRQQTASRRRTNSTARIMLSKAKPLRRHPVQLRRPNPLLPITAQIPIPKVIRQNKQNIRPGSRRRFCLLLRTPCRPNRDCSRPPKPPAVQFPFHCGLSPPNTVSARYSATTRCPSGVQCWS